MLEIDTDGNAVKPILDDTSKIGGVTFILSPDRKQIASSDSRDIYLLDIETNKTYKLTNFTIENAEDPHWVTRLSWSSSGDEISFLFEKNDEYNVYSIKPNGDNLHRITDTSFEDSMIFPSPDKAKKIAFITSVYQPNYQVENTLYFLKNGSNPILVSETTDTYKNPVSWSPDGNQLAFLQPVTKDTERVCVLDILTSNIDCHPHLFYWAISPVWSPNGEKIATYGVSTDTPDEFELVRISDVYIFNSDGTNFRNISLHPYADDRAPTWAPDGTKLAFLSNRDGKTQIYTIGVDENNLTRITNFESCCNIVGWTQ